MYFVIIAEMAAVKSSRLVYLLGMVVVSKNHHFIVT